MVYILSHVRLELVFKSYISKLQIQLSTSADVLVQFLSNPPNLQPGLGQPALSLGQLSLDLREPALGSGEVDLEDASLQYGVVEHLEGLDSILSSGHGDEAKPLAPPRGVDNSGLQNVSKVSEEHRQVVLSVSERNVADVKSQRSHHGHVTSLDISGVPGDPKLQAGRLLKRR